MKKITLVSLLLGVMFSTSALAAVGASELSWVPPTTRVDGTVLQPTEIAEFQVFYAIDEDVTTESSMVSVGGTNTSQVVELEFTPRPEKYVVNFAILTVSTDGLKSDLSDPVSKEFLVNSTAKPNAPTRIQFNMSCTSGCVIEMLSPDQ